MGFLQTLRESLMPSSEKAKGLPGRRIIGEIVGRVSSLSTYWTNRWRITPTVDRTQTDAAFWDRTRRGLTPGLELSAPLLNPIYSKIAAWSLGQAPTFKFESDPTQQAFDEWLEDNHAALLETMEESLALGTPYLLINADLSCTILPPDVVDPIVDPNDYSRFIGYRVTEVWPHPDNPADVMRITDDYYANERVVTVYHKGKPREQRFKNLLGRLPIIPIPNKKGLNEAYGRPEAEALLTVMYEYNDVMKYAITGNKNQGRPTPVIEKMGTPEYIEKFWQQHGKPYTYTDESGAKQTGYNIDFDSDNLMTLANDATFKWASPASFMNDVAKLLELFFYIIVQHSELPEFIFGVAIASSKASADAQLPTFTKFIEKKQSLSRRWLIEVAEIVTGYMSLVQRRVRMERPTIRFEPLTTADGNLTLKSVMWAYKQGLLDDMTALTLLTALDIDDPMAVLKKAKEEAAARQAEQDKRDEDLMLAQAERRAADAEDQPDSTDVESDEAEDDTAESITAQDWPQRAELVMS
jgi:hypothetical protein